MPITGIVSPLPPEVTLSIDFATNKTLTPSVGPTPIFERASVAKFRNASGIWEEAAVVIPAIELVVGTIKAGTQFIATTDPVDTTGADLLVVASSWYSDSGGVVDSKGNTWTKLTTLGPSSPLGAIWYCYPTVGKTGSGHTVSQTVGLYSSVALFAFKNTIAAGFDQQSGRDISPATVLDASNLTPALPNSLIVTFAGLFTNTVTPTYPAGFTGGLWAPYVSGQAMALGAAYKIATDGADSNPSWAWSSSSNAIVGQAIFKPAN